MPGDGVGDHVGGVGGGNVDSTDDPAIYDKTKVRLTLNRLHATFTFSSYSRT